MSVFGLTFDEVTVEDIVKAQTYLFNTYETNEAEFNFYRTNRGIDQFDIQEILEYDTQVLHELLD